MYGSNTENVAGNTQEVLGQCWKMSRFTTKYMVHFFRVIYDSDQAL